MNTKEELFEAYKKVNIGCHDCQGCSDCCRGMGNSIILDPFDFYQLEKGLKCSAQELLAKEVELNLSEGLILPNLKMQQEGEKCAFLNEAGRCGVHTFRPGLCRLFPLGRNYAQGKLSYFILEEACSKPGERTKVKITDWIGLEKMQDYEQFLTDWHYYLKGIREKTAALPENEWESAVKNASMHVLNVFYLKTYCTNQDFYPQFYERMKR